MRSETASRRGKRPALRLPREGDIKAVLDFTPGA
jgi:hypothetical protein